MHGHVQQGDLQCHGRPRVGGVALPAGAGVGLGCVRRRPLPVYQRLMIAYDGGWAPATLAALLVAWRGGTVGGEIWLGYQVTAPPVLAALLACAAPPARPVVS
ncbi:hypothetical protein ACQEVS_01645 [Streptomyces sp. CA-181903]|uniref:hypothetical protein n=1 Tax=Streptomyces sp. CA-181903 TaxID=3240055 RepID=UPI003D8ACF08